MIHKLSIFELFRRLWIWLNITFFLPKIHFRRSIVFGLSRLSKIQRAKFSLNISNPNRSRNLFAQKMRRSVKRMNTFPTRFNPMLNNATRHVSRSELMFWEIRLIYHIPKTLCIHYRHCGIICDHNQFVERCSSYSSILILFIFLLRVCAIIQINRTT